MFWVNGPEKQAGIVLLSNKIGFKLKLIRRDKHWHCMFSKGKIHGDIIGILNIHAPNTNVPKLVK